MDEKETMIINFAKERNGWFTVDDICGVLFDDYIGGNTLLKNKYRTAVRRKVKSLTKYGFLDTTQKPCKDSRRVFCAWYRIKENTER